MEENELPQFIRGQFIQAELRELINVPDNSTKRTPGASDRIRGPVSNVRHNSYVPFMMYGTVRY